MIEVVQISTNVVLAGMAILQVILLYVTLEYASVELKKHREKLKLEEERKFVFELIDDFRSYDFYNQLLYKFRVFDHVVTPPTITSITSYINTEENRIRRLKAEYSESKLQAYRRIEQNTWLLDKFEEIVKVREIQDQLDGILNVFDNNFATIKEALQNLNPSGVTNPEEFESLVTLCQNLPKGLEDRENDDVCLYIYGIRKIKENLKKLI